MSDLTEAETAILRRGFRGPRPGSNAFPLLELQCGDVKIAGERLDALHRSGILVAKPALGPPVPCIKGGDAGPYGEIPDVEMTHRYELR